jgi:predicted RNA-binding protein YlqC (UPF0109 family)
MSTSIDQQFVEYVVKSLVSHPDAVVVDRRVDEKGVLLELTVDPEDLGRVIGKRGATAQSLRTLLRALGTKNEARYNLKIVDNGPAPGTEGRPERVERADKPARAPKEDKPADDSDRPEKSQLHPYNDNLDNDEEVAALAKLDAAAAEAEEPAAKEEPKDESSDRLAQTRAELADLDDLDI